VRMTAEVEPEALNRVAAGVGIQSTDRRWLALVTLCLGDLMIVPPHARLRAGRRPGHLGKPRQAEPAAARREEPDIVRWYQEDQVMNVVRSEPLNIDRVSEISFEVKGELEDVFDSSERIVAVVIQRPYVRQVYVP
jgi:hypothetical protein